MKNKFITLVSLLLVCLLFVFSGCNSAVTLTFNNAFNNKNEPSGSYVEEVTYTVKNKDYQALVKDSRITEEIFTANISGTYKTVLTLLSSIPEDVLTDLDVTSPGKDQFLEFKSELTLDATYKTKGVYAGSPIENADGSKTYKDKIVNRAIFYMAGQAFSPIYSETKSVYTYLTSNSGTPEAINVNLMEYEYKTVYNTKKYTTDKSIKINGGEAQTSSKTYSYTQKTAIDNNSLLFAIRNISIEVEKSFSMPTISPTYGTATTLSVKNEEAKSIDVNMTYNGVNPSATSTTVLVPVNHYSFIIDSQKNTGIQQYVSVQSSAVDNLPSKALVIEYAQPLSVYGTFFSLGALVYTIESVNITE